MSAEVTVAGIRGQGQSVFEERAQVTFSLEDGTQIMVMVANGGRSLEIRNLGRGERTRLNVRPVVSNVIEVEGAR